MMPEVNIIVLGLATLLFAVFYVLSIQPAKLEERIGEVSYARCTTYRTIASILEAVIFFSYVIFYFLPSPILGELPWRRWISILIALVIGVPALVIMFKGIMDSGQEGLSPSKKHKMFGGIYNRVRHPQTVGGVLLWFAIAIGSHSSFLVLYSCVWIPIYGVACHLEEADLVRRYGQAYEAYQKRVGMFLPRSRGKSES
jgi:protein-S-isoprenylcysteine O-methyltransferase Ste14